MIESVEIANRLWDALWQDYSQRVEYARIYQQMIREAGYSIANDHLAFRSLALTIDTSQGKINLGIPYLAQIFEALGYVEAEQYTFSDRHLPTPECPANILTFSFISAFTLSTFFPDFAEIPIHSYPIFL